MMLKLTTPAGVYGPYHQITELADRYDCDGRHLPFTVVGTGTIAEWEGALPEPPLPPPPAAVTMRQARLALLGAGLLDSVDAAIAAIPDATERQAAQIEWEYAADVVRDSPLVAALSGALGLTEAQLDDLFRNAATL